VDALPVPRDQAEAEVRKELALVLYARGTLTSQQLCSCLGLTRWEVEDLLAHRRVVRPYLTDAVAEEMGHARYGQ
jgi:predicted HTH domain antitoxin